MYFKKLRLENALYTSCATKVTCTWSFFFFYFTHNVMICLVKTTEKKLARWSKSSEITLYSLPRRGARVLPLNVFLQLLAGHWWLGGLKINIRQRFICASEPSARNRRHLSLSSTLPRCALTNRHRANTNLFRQLEQIRRGRWSTEAGVRTKRPRNSAASEVEDITSCSARSYTIAKWNKRNGKTNGKQAYAFLQTLNK